MRARAQPRPSTCAASRVRPRRRAAPATLPTPGLARNHGSSAGPALKRSRAHRRGSCCSRDGHATCGSARSHRRLHTWPAAVVPDAHSRSTHLRPTPSSAAQPAPRPTPRSAAGLACSSVPSPIRRLTVPPSRDDRRHLALHSYEIITLRLQARYTEYFLSDLKVRAKEGSFLQVALK